MAGMVGSTHGAEGFQGDLNTALEQLAERDNPTPQPEESEDSRVARQRYELAEQASREEMKTLQAEALDLRSQAARGLKVLHDKAEEHRADASNYAYDSNGDLLYFDQAGAAYRVVGNGGTRQFVRIKGAVRSNPDEFAAAERQAMDRAFAAAKRRKSSSIVRE